MKKIIALLVLVLIYSCDSEEQKSRPSGMEIDNEYTNSTQINPPAWIQGKWADTKGQVFEFTKSNLTCDSYGNIYSAKGAISSYEIQGKDPEVVQKQTETTYTLQFNVSASEKRTYDFIKISDNQIESKGAFKGIYTKK